MELYLGRRGPDMELDLESGLEIKGGEPDAEEAEPFETVMCYVDASLLVLCCILVTAAVVAFGNLPFQPALALTAVAGTVFVVLVLAITAARDKYIDKHMADNVGAPN